MSNDKISSNVKLGLRSNKRAQRPATYAADIDVPVEELGLKGSPTKVKKSMTKEAKGAGEIVKESAPEAVAYVLGKLKEKHYI